MSLISSTAAAGNYAGPDVERLKGQKPGSLEQEKARLRKATQEFESLFMYQMLKAMRQTVGESSLAEGSPMSYSLGKDTFMDMFDVQLSPGHGLRRYGINCGHHVQVDGEARRSTLQRRS